MTQRWAHRVLRELVVSPSVGHRLERAKLWLASFPRDAEVLILASHAQASDELVRAVVADFGSRFGIRRATPGQLASQLAAPAMARRGLASGTSLALSAVAARAVHRLVEEGTAGRFSVVARRPGFPHAVARTFEDLRAAGVTPDSLHSVPPWGDDLARLVARMEQELDEMGIADRATVYDLAVTQIAESTPLPAGMPLLLLDLSIDRGPERRFVAALLTSSARVLATAAEGDGVAIAALEGLLGVVASRDLVGDSARSLARLQRHLFQDTAPEFQSLDDSVSLTSWPGESRECVEIARSIQAEAARGVPFDRMAIFLRAPGAYRAHIAEALRRASIPAYFARGTTLPDPAGRAMLALLACAAEGLSARRFAEYLSLAQVPDPGNQGRDPWMPPDHDLLPMPPVVLERADPTDAEDVNSETTFDPTAATIDGALRAPWRWERLMAEAAVIGGADRWRRRLDGLAAEVALRRNELAEEDARVASLERKSADLEHLREFALPLIERLAALSHEAAWDVWLSRLKALTGAAIRHPAGVMAVLAELEPLGPVGPVDLTMVQHVLAPRLRDLTSLPERRPQGATFVAPVEMARGLEFDVVFVPGLAEKLFPQRILQDPLLPDEARRTVGDGTLATQDTRVALERLGLRLSAGAAKARLELSWPRVDVESTRPRVPSFYGVEALRAAEGRLVSFEQLRSLAGADGHARLGWPAPERPEDAIDDTEYDLAVLARLKGSDPAASAGAATYLLKANQHLARALRTRGRRWLRRWTPADGLVDPDAQALASIARHRVGARSFSPTALEAFSACPYRFLLQAVHRLQPREEVEALETIDPLTRGALFHEIQFEVLTALRDEGRLPLEATALDIAFTRLDESVGRLSAAYAERLAPAIPRVWEDGVSTIRSDLREWLRRLGDGAGDWVPHRFELSFGLPENARNAADFASVPEPVAVLDGMLLRGSIDLVERRPDGALRVTDHKTGKTRTKEGAVVSGGQALQPVLYALAAESLLSAPVESGRLYYCTADGDFVERVIPLDEVSRAYAKTAIGVVARAIEQGFLPAAPEKDACQWCNYRPVCGPHEELRTARKPPDRLADLRELRDLP